MLLPISARRRTRLTARAAAAALVSLLVASQAAVHAQDKPDLVPPESPKWALTGNMLELMRGVFFPNANMIFNVQSHNPAEKKPTAQSSSSTAFNWNLWGASLYSGWEDVDYAAVVLAEISPALLTPGRTCENGKPVPVGRADWIKFSVDMMKAAQKSYEAAKTKNQEAVSDSTNDLSDACQACHRVYRDRRPPGVDRTAPNATALRCTAP